jgi:hypothetical protein
MNYSFTSSLRQTARLFYALLLFCFCLPLAQAQCPAGNGFGVVVLSSQADVNAFPTGCVNLPIALYIEGADINDLTRLGALQRIDGRLTITNNPLLSSLTGLGSLTGVGNRISIEENPQLTNLVGLEGLATVVGALEVEQNAALLNLTGLSSLTTVGGTLDISNNRSLTSLTGLVKLTNVGSLFIQSNDKLINAAGLSSLTSTGGSLVFQYCTRLNSLGGLENITNVPGSLLIYQSNVRSLNGLNGLTSVGDDLQLTLNDDLTDLSALNKLTSIGGSLEITDNNALEELTGLSSLTSIVGSLEITFNRSLSNCSIEAVCRYLANPPGSVNISDNDDGCNSREEVEANCPAVAVVITRQPPSASSVCAGATVTATVSVTGLPRNYQWYKDSFASPVLSQTTATLTLTNVTTANAGSYSVVVSNSVSNLTSNAFTLTVNQATVSLGNNGPLVCGGVSSATLTASPAGTGTYRFSAGASPSGPSNNNTATVTQAGVYSVTLTANGCSNVASTTVTGDTALPNVSSTTQPTPNGLAVQVFGGVSYERLKSIERVNGYQIRQSEINGTGAFLITQPGPYSITVIGGNGCVASVTGVAN